MVYLVVWENLQDPLCDDIQIYDKKEDAINYVKFLFDKYGKVNIDYYIIEGVRVYV